MTAGLTESAVEDAALGWLESLGYAVLYGLVSAADACYKDVPQ